MTCGQGQWGEPFEITKGGETAFLQFGMGSSWGSLAFGQWLMAFNDIAGDQECESEACCRARPPQPIDLRGPF